MKPIEFPEQSHVLAKDQPPYRPLPVLIDNNPGHNGQVISVWKLDDDEVELVGRTKKIYFSQSAFGKAPMPIFMTAKRGEIFSEEGPDLEPVVPFPIFHSTTIAANFIERLRILFGKPIKYSITINVDRQCEVVSNSNQKCYVEPIFPKKQKGLVSYASLDHLGQKID